MTNTIYNYSHQTGEYISQSKSDESPLELGVILIPAFSTPNAPPKTEMHQVAVYRSTNGSIPAFHGDGEWMVMPDWRGISMFSIADGNAVEITEIGKIPADVAATETPAPGRGYTYINSKWVVDPQQQAEISKEVQRQRLVEIDAKLSTIDAASARPAREIALSMGQGEAASTVAIAKLTELETQAAALRAERQQLRVN
jgi:hypothetical protein